jgi:hypothetical protein
VALPNEMISSYHFISFHLYQMKWARLAPIISFRHNDIILFGKFTGMTGYQTGIKVRHGMKIMQFQINSITNSVAAKQVTLEITNEFFNSSPK